MAKQGLSVESFIANGKSSGGAGTSIEFAEFETGSGVGGAKWRKTGITGITPVSQTPAEYYQTSALNAGKFVDSAGDEWELIQRNGQIVGYQLGASDSPSVDDSVIYQCAIVACDKSVLIVGNPKLGGLICPSNKAVYGQLLGSTKVLHDVTINQDLINVSEPVGMNEHFEAKGFTVEVEGAGRSAIRLPKSANTFSRQFTFNIHINSNLYNLGPDGYSEGIRLGDCGKGNITGEFRGGYVPENDDTGQYQSSMIVMDAASGCIGVTFNVMTVNYRIPVVIGESVENFFLDNSELVNCWIGVDDISTIDKPGGYFGSSLHINSNYRCIRLNNRRDFNVGDVQLYRASSYFAHGLGWRGLEINDATRFNLGKCSYRNVKNGTGDAPVEFINCSKFTSENQIVGNDTGMDRGFIFDTCSAFKGFGATFASAMGSWYELDSCSNYSIDSHESTDASIGEVYIITNDYGSGRIDRTGAAKDKFETATFSANDTVNLSINQIEKEIIYNLTAGTSAYTVDVVMPATGQLEGDVFSFFIKYATSGLNPTLRFLDSDGVTVRYDIPAPGSISNKTVKMLYNGSGWVVNGLFDS